MSFALMTDSGADLPLSYLKEHDVCSMPITFMMHGKAYPDDGVSMPLKVFYAEMRAGTATSTAMVNPEACLKYFTPVLEQGRDVLCLSLSSGLSGSYNSAVVAAQILKGKFPDRIIHVADTLCASMGQGLLVDFCVRMRDEGRSIDEVYDWVEKNKMRMSHLVTVSDLAYLRRGGRISRTSAIVGGLIGIKPLIYMNREGKLIPDGKVRGRKAALLELVERMGKYVDAHACEHMAISHADCEEDARFVCAEFKKRHKVGRMIMGQIGSVIGSHSGPGTVAFFALGKMRKA